VQAEFNSSDTPRAGVLESRWEIGSAGSGLAKGGVSHDHFPGRWSDDQEAAHTAAVDGCQRSRRNWPQRVYQRLKGRMGEELLGMVRMMMSKPNHEIFGPGEFELRQKLNAVGADDPGGVRQYERAKSKKGYYAVVAVLGACGASAKFVNWREKTVMSAFGDIRLSCSYYRLTCIADRASSRGTEQLRLGSRRVTAGAERSHHAGGPAEQFPASGERARWFV